MRINGSGSEVDLEVIRQASKQIELVQTTEGIKRQIEREVKQDIKETAPSREELQRLIQEIRRKLDYLNKYLKIDIDDQLEIPVVKIFERDTNRLIRQIPPDYLLELMKKIDQMLGVLLSERV